MAASTPVQRWLCSKGYELAEPVRPRRFPWLWFLFGLLAIILFAGSPMIPVIWASEVAASHGCTLHEGFINPCIVNGVDMGKDLYAAGMLGWLMLATMPLGALAFLVWLVLLVIMLVLHMRGKRKPEPNA